MFKEKYIKKYIKILKNIKENRMKTIYPNVEDKNY